MKTDACFYVTFGITKEFKIYALNEQKITDLIKSQSLLLGATIVFSYKSTLLNIYLLPT